MDPVWDLDLVLNCDVAYRSAGRCQPSAVSAVGLSLPYATVRWTIRHRMDQPL